MPEDPEKIEEIIRHYLETGDDTSRAEFAYKPPFPRPTKEEFQQTSLRGDYYESFDVNCGAHDE